MPARRDDCGLRAPQARGDAVEALGRVLAGDPDQVVGAAGSFVPRFGSRKSVRGAVTFCVKSNMFMMLPAVASKDPPPIR